MTLPYMWLGEAAERDPEVLMAYYPPEPLVVVDDSDQPYE